MRPRAVYDAFARYGITRGDVVLVDCDYAERNARLHGPRGQGELANAQMDCWAAYLRGQADALGVPVLSTSGVQPESGVAFLRNRIARLQDPAGGEEGRLVPRDP